MYFLDTWIAALSRLRFELGVVGNSSQVSHMDGIGFGQVFNVNPTMCVILVVHLFWKLLGLCFSACLVGQECLEVLPGQCLEYFGEHV